MSVTPSITPPQTPSAHGAPLFEAAFKQAPEDFKVFEKLSIDFSGEGEHLYLQLEKIGRNTSDVVNALKRCFKVPKKDIGVAGQKDKHAVTTQWFSVLTPSDAAPLETWLASDDAPPFRLLDVARHRKKLRLGAHDANGFVIRLNEVNYLAGDKTLLDERIAALKTLGFPNYFGPQRFGHQGANLNKGLQWLTGSERIPSMARDKRSHYLSAVRSAAFNRVLAARVQRGNWNHYRLGELCVLNGSQSVFLPNAEEVDATVARMQIMDIHPSAALIGDGPEMNDLDALNEDRAARQTDPNHAALINALCRLRVSASHRATRALCNDIEYTWLNEHTIEISFTLAPGVFATTLLNELFKERNA